MADNQLPFFPMMDDPGGQIDLVLILVQENLNSRPPGVHLEHPIPVGTVCQEYDVTIADRQMRWKPVEELDRLDRSKIESSDELFAVARQFADQIHISDRPLLMGHDEIARRRLHRVSYVVDFIR